MVEERSPRVSVPLPPMLMKSLRRWASTLGDKPSTLAGFILRAEIEKAIADGRIPPESEEEESEAAMAPLLAKLIDGEELTAEEEEELATACNRDPIDINQASRKIRARNGNGERSQSKASR